MQAFRPIRPLRSAAGSFWVKRSINRYTLTFQKRNISTEPENAELTPVERYEMLVSKHIVDPDPHQRKILKQLMPVYQDLYEYDREHHRIGELARRRQHSALYNYLLSKVSPLVMDHAPQGVYLYGDVGCGKTMLMDIFYSSVPSHLTKRRLHFHAFMQDIHHKTHKYKTSKSSQEDAVLAASHDVATESDVICLDEVAVVDVADAMVLRHVFEALYHDGVTTFMTSNRKPDDLYLNGVQRKSFVPAIELIKHRNHVICLDSETDYRTLDTKSSGSFYITDFDPKNHVQMAAEKKKAEEHALKWFNTFGKGESPVHNRTLHVWGRPIIVPKSAGNNVMQFSFHELCCKPLSSADYLELCKTFNAAVITDIPHISHHRRDLIRRFITFIDAAYDTHMKLAVTAVSKFENMFETSDDAELAGHEEMFAFHRALSRLHQMSTSRWNSIL